MDITQLKKILSLIDISSIDIEELKTGLISKGWKSEDVDLAISELNTITNNTNIDTTLNTNDVDVNKMESNTKESNATEYNTTESNDINSNKNAYKSDKIISEIKYLREKGNDDNTIMNFLLEKDYLKVEIDDAFLQIKLEKENHQKYISEFSKNLKLFIEKGYNKFYIRRQFISAGWDDSLFDECYYSAERENEFDKKSLALEKEILHRLIGGENKEHLIKILVEKGWPDDILKKNFENLDTGVSALNNALNSIDVNKDNIVEIKKILVEKGWPEELVDITISRIFENHKYYSKLLSIQDEVRQMISSGLNSKQIEEHLRNENIPEHILKRMLLKMNVEFIRDNNVERLKTFNNTNLKRKHHHEFSDLSHHFKSVSNIDNENNLHLSVPSSLKKNK